MDLTLDFARCRVVVVVVVALTVAVPAWTSVPASLEGAAAPATTAAVPGRVAPGVLAFELSRHGRDCVAELCRLFLPVVGLVDALVEGRHLLAGAVAAGTTVLASAVLLAVDGRVRLDPVLSREPAPHFGVSAAVAVHCTHGGRVARDDPADELQVEPFDQGFARLRLVSFLLPHQLQKAVQDRGDDLRHLVVMAPPGVDAVRAECAALCEFSCREAWLPKWTSA